MILLPCYECTILLRTYFVRGGEYFQNWFQYGPILTDPGRYACNSLHGSLFRVQPRVVRLRIA